LLWFIAIAGIAVVLSLADKFNNGYALFIYPPYRMEMSLNLFVFLLMGGVFLIYGFARLAIHTLQLPAKVREFRLQRKRNEAHRAMADGLRAFLEGRYGRAEKSAAKAMELGETPALNAIIAAYSAHHLRRSEKSQSYLIQAESITPDESVAQLMAQAEILLERHQPNDALIVLKTLKDRAGLHTAALRLKLKAYQLVGDWQQILQLLPQLEKRAALEPGQLEQLRVRAYVETLRAKASDLAAVKTYWQKIPSFIKSHPGIAETAARIFINLNAHDTAYEIIEQRLGYTWSATLIDLYGNAPQDKDVTRQIEHAEKWLEGHSQDAGLLVTLGRLCFHQQLWGKAQSYLEASLALEQSHTAHLLLGQIFDKLEKNRPAQEHYRRALELALKQLQASTGGRRKLAL
jgi:HemY protein